ncbi:MAG: TonB-dependent receptor [Rhizomicrobium sp.]
MSLATAARAQETVETVVVTGSRIPQQGLYSSSPVSVVGQEEFKQEAATNIEMVLRDLPSTVLDGDNSAINNGSSGLSTVDLRGLGANRTLVLADGKRLQPANAGGVVDLAQIPAALVDHVEVLTGGASSTYGGDAVAGVVNLILRKDFEGVELNGQYQSNNYGDGPIEDLSFIMGSNSANGKGNVLLYGEYYNQAAISDAARPWGAHVLSSPNGVGCASPIHSNGFCYGGSGGIPQGRLTDIGQIFTGAYDGTPPGELVPYAGQTYSFAPSEFLQAQHTRYALGGNGHYEVSKMLDIYARVMYSDNDNHNQLAPIPVNTIVSLNCGNPLMTAQERTVLFGAATCAAAGATNDTTVQHIYRARMTASGNRNTDIRNTAYQVMIGARGDFGNGWTYDLSGSYGQSQQIANLTGDADVAKFQDTLLSDDGVTCTNGDPNCFPADIYHQQIAIDPRAAAYYAAPDISRGLNQEWDLQTSLVGDLGAWGVKSPWAKSPVGIALGGEYRQEKSVFNSAGPIATPNASAGYGYAGALAGAYDVTEGYTEVRVPLVEDVPGFESLEFEGGYRYSSYNLAGDTQTWKTALNWQVVDDFKLRGSIDRAVREPHIGELFGAPTQSAINSYDPCGPAGAGQLVGSAALCAATGVPNGAYQSEALDCQGQCTGYLESNPALHPERAVTKSIGFVLTPTFLPGFTATVDYYDIKINGAVSTVPMQTALAECYDPNINTAQSAAAPACQRVHRDQFGTIFSLGYVQLPLENIDSDAAKGIDFEAHYRTGLDTFSWDNAGSIALDFRGTYVESASFTSDGITDQCAGHYDQGFCDVPNPRWRHMFRLTWNSPNSDFSIYGTWRHLSSTVEPDLLGGVDPLDAHAPSADYFDLGGSWQISDRYSVYGGALNVFNKKPPLFDDQIFNPATENANTFPGVYDSLGVVLFAGVNIKM